LYSISGLLSFLDWWIFLSTNLLSELHSPKGLLYLFDPLSPSELPKFDVALIQQGAKSIF